MLTEETKKKLCECYRDEDTNEKYSVCTLDLELTRKCNLKCLHCMKGEAQEIDMEYRYIDSIFEQINVVYKLSLAGGEITLALDKMRYVLESCKRHDVYIEKLYLVTNGIIMSEEFLNIWDDFLSYVQLPKESRIVISSDKYHRMSSGMSNNEFKKHCSFYRRGKKNVVLLQDVASNPRNIYRVGRLEKNPISKISDSEFIEKYKAWYMGSSYRKGKRAIKHYGKHICVLNVTALGNVLIDDIISYIDEDNEYFYNGNIEEGISIILQRQKEDPYLNSVGKFINYATDFKACVEEIIRPFTNNILVSLCGFSFGAHIDKEKMIEQFNILKELTLTVLSIKNDVLKNLREEDNSCLKTYNIIEKENMLSKIDNAINQLL